MNSARHRALLAADLKSRLIERRRSEAASGSELPPILGAIQDLARLYAAPLPSDEQATVADLLRRDTVGLGPLEELLSDVSVDEVLVVGASKVWVERDGSLELTSVRFGSEAELFAVIDRILGPLGRRVDELSPMTDARLPDGSRLNVTLPPLALDGPCLSIRRFGSGALDIERLRERKTLSGASLRALRDAVEQRKSILISGGTGAGKTTLLNALSEFIANEERVITIEDAAELSLRQPHVVRLETRPPNIEGRGLVTIRDLLRNALRMRPDRLVIGEVRGAEAFDLISALNTGHEGTMSTIHANSPRDAIARLATLASLAELTLPSEVIREQIGRGFDVVVQISRLGDGSRRVTSIAEFVDGDLAEVAST